MLFITVWSFGILGLIKYSIIELILDEYQADSRTRKLTTFTPSNTLPHSSAHNTKWEDGLSSLAQEVEENVIHYNSRENRPGLYSGSIDRREILRRNQRLHYPQDSDTKLTKHLRHNISDLYPDNNEIVNHGNCSRYNTISPQMYDTTLPRRYQATSARNFPSAQQYSIPTNLEHSVFRNKRSREDTWLV